MISKNSTATSCPAFLLKNEFKVFVSCANLPSDSGSTEHWNEIFFVARDPILFEETVIFYHKINGGYTVPPRTEDFEYQILADFEDVFPIGYPTE